MAKKSTGQKMITAQHITRTDSKGSALVKKFTRKAWDNIPAVDYMTSDGRVKQAKQGWIEVGEQKGAKAPEPLTKKEEVQTTAEPVKPAAEPVKPAAPSPIRAPRPGDTQA